MSIWAGKNTNRTPLRSFFMMQVGDFLQNIPPWLLNSKVYYVVAMDLQGFYVYVNQSLQNRFEGVIQNFVGLHYTYTIHPQDVPLYEQTVITCLRNPTKTYTLDVRKIHKNSKTFQEEWIRWEISALCDKTGEIIGIVRIGHDISEQKYQERQLQQNLKFYESLLQFIPHALYRIDLAGQVTFANEVLLRNLGVSLQEVLGKTAYNFYPEHLANKYRQDDAEVIRTGRTLTFIEEHILPTSKEKLYVEVCKSPIRNSENVICGIQGIFWDITGKMQQEQELKKLSLIAKHTSNVVIITDTQRKITWVNEEFTNLTGYAFEEVIGKNPASFLQFEKTDATTLQMVREKLNNLEGVRFEILNKGKTGNVYWLDVEIQPLRDEDGTFIGFMAIQNDITPRKHAEQVAFMSQSQLFSTLNNTPNVAIQWYDEKGVILSWNPASETLYGWKAEEAIGKTLDQLIYAPEEAKRFLAVLEEVKRTGKPCTPYESPIFHKNNTGGWILTTTFSIPLDGERIGFVCMDVDITRLKKTEQELIESKEKYKSIVSAVAEGLVVQDLQDKILMANQAASDILGLSWEQLLGKDSYHPQWKAMHEDGTPFLPEDHPTMITLRTGKNVDNVIMNVHTGKGERKYISINARPMYDYKGEMSGVVASFTDITKYKEAEQQIKASELLLRTSMEASLEAIFLLEAIKDEVGKVVDFIIKDLNQNAARQLAYKREDLIGKRILQDCNEYFTVERFEQFKQIMQNEQPVEEEIYLENAGWYYQQIVPMPKGIALYIRNITERKQAEQKIVEQNETLKQIAWQQSHEVRRPVATILGLIHLIKDEKDTRGAFSMEYIDYLHQTVQELDAIIHKIVEYTYPFE